MAILNFYILSCLIYFLQGINSLPAQSLFVWMKNTLGLSPEQIMFYGSISGIAWCIKPLLAIFIDFFNISKKQSIAFSLLFNVVIFLIFGLLKMPLFFVIACLTIINFSDCIRDISSDGLMCVIGKANKACGKIQALNWGTITFASILVGIFGGELAQNLNYRIGYLCLIPVLLIAFLVTRFLKEEVADNKVKFTDLKKVFLNKQFLLVCLFLFLYKFSPSFGTVLAFKQRDIFQWSERFIGYLGAFLSVFEILGAILYFKFSQRINLKKWIFWSVILGGITTLLYLYYTSITAIVYGILFSFIGMFIHLVCMDFMARNSIKNLETCSFAMLCAISNLSATASSLTGAYLYPKVGLDWLIVISALTSFVCLFFITKIKF